MSGMAQIIDLPLPVLRERLAGGAARASDVAEAVQKRIEGSHDARDGLAWYDADYAGRVAKSRDNYRLQAKSLGALHGVPVLVEDSCDMARVPMQRGFAPLEGAVSERDSSIVAGLRSAGAQLFAKASIPALRVGSGAIGAPKLVASGCYPLAVCIDARGEALRSAAMAGVCAYRPSADLVALINILDLVPSLDGVVLMASDIADLAALADVLSTHDAADPRREARPRPNLTAALDGSPPMPPTIGFLTDGRDEASGAAEELAETLGDRGFHTALPELFAEAELQCERIAMAEGAKCLKPFERRFSADMPEDIREWIAKGEAISAVDYLRARDWITVLRAGMNEIFERCSVAGMIGPIGGQTPLVSGETLAAFLGLPALTLPILQTPKGDPMGLTLLAKPDEDVRLMQSAAWLLKTLHGDDA